MTDRRSKQPSQRADDPALVAIKKGAYPKRASSFHSMSRLIVPDVKMGGGATRSPLEPQTRILEPPSLRTVRGGRGQWPDTSNDNSPNQEFPFQLMPSEGFSAEAFSELRAESQPKLQKGNSQSLLLRKLSIVDSPKINSSAFDSIDYVPMNSSNEFKAKDSIASPQISTPYQHYQGDKQLQGASPNSTNLSISSITKASPHTGTHSRRGSVTFQTVSAKAMAKLRKNRKFSFNESALGQKVGPHIPKNLQFIVQLNIDFWVNQCLGIMEHFRKDPLEGNPEAMEKYFRSRRDNKISYLILVGLCQLAILTDTVGSWIFFDSSIQTSESSIVNLVMLPFRLANNGVYNCAAMGVAQTVVYCLAFALTLTMVQAFHLQYLELSGRRAVVRDWLIQFQDIILSLLTLLLYPFFTTKVDNIMHISTCVMLLQAYNTTSIVDSQGVAAMVLFASLNVMLSQSKWMLAGHDIASQLTYSPLPLVLVVQFSFGIRQAIVDRKNQFVAKCRLETQKKDNEVLFSNIPYGVLIYKAAAQESNGEGQKQPSLKIKFVNDELFKILQPFNSNKRDIKELLNTHQFRLKKVQKTASAFQLDDVLSLKQIAQECGREESTLILQYEAFSEVIDTSSVGMRTDSKKSLSDQVEQTTEPDGTKLIKKILHLEVSVRKISYEGQEANILILHNINSIISNQSKLLQLHYQQAITATISHEQMNPLNSIINFSKYLYQQTKLHLGLRDNSFDEGSEGNEGSESSNSLGSVDEEESFGDRQEVSVSKADLREQLHVVHIVHSSSMMMKLLNSAMLTLTLLKQNKYQPKLEPVRNPSVVAKSLLKIFSEHLKQKDISLRVHDLIPNNSKAAWALQQKGLMFDKILYKQILFNIVANACKFNKKEGRIDVRLLAELIRADKSSTGSPQIKLVTEVEDTGVGIDKEQKARLFKLFEGIRVQAQRNGQWEDGDQSVEAQRSTSGNGLGLYLSQKLAQSLQGDIQVESELLVGTKVKISLVFDLGSSEQKGSFKSVKKSESSYFLKSSLSLRNQKYFEKASISFRNILGSKKNENKEFLNSTLTGFQLGDSSSIKSFDKDKQPKHQARDTTSEGGGGRYASDLNLSKRQKSQFYRSHHWKSRPTELGEPLLDSASEFSMDDQASIFKYSQDLLSSNRKKKRADSMYVKRPSFVNSDQLSSASQQINIKLSSNPFQNRLTKRLNKDELPQKGGLFREAKKGKNPMTETPIFNKRVAERDLQNSLQAYFLPSSEEADLSSEEGSSKLQRLASQYLTEQRRVDLNLIDERCSESESTVSLTSYFAKHGIAYPIDLPAPAPKQEIDEASEQRQKTNSEVTFQFKRKSDLSSSIPESSLADFSQKDSQPSFLTENFGQEESSLKQEGSRKAGTDLKLTLMRTPSDGYPKSDSQLQVSIEDSKDSSQEEPPSFNPANAASHLNDLHEALFLIEEVDEEHQESESNKNSNLRSLSSQTLSSFESINLEEVVSPPVKAKKRPEYSRSCSELSSIQNLEIDQLALPSWGIKKVHTQVESSQLQRRGSLRPRCHCGQSQILIVDDNPFNLETLKLLIAQKAQCEPDTANDGLEALHMFKKKNCLVQEEEGDDPLPVKRHASGKQACQPGCPKQFYSLVFMDLNMPVMDGFESGTKILEFQARQRRLVEEQGLDAKPKAAVVALTAFVDDTTIQKCKKIGMAEFLNKPASSKDVVQMIKKYCSE